MRVDGPHVWFEPGDTIGAIDLTLIEGPQQAICTPSGSCHVVMNLVDTHRELLRSMVLAGRREWLRR